MEFIEVCSCFAGYLEKFQIMRVLRLFLLFSLLAISSLYAQHSGTLRGRITTKDGKPAEGVSVGIRGTTHGSLTDEFGEYRITKVSPGTHVLVVSAVGLKTQDKTIDLQPKASLIVDFSLMEDLAQLQEVVVAASRNRFKADKVSPSLRLQTPLLEVPQNIKVITKELLADQQVFDMVDGVTRNVSGAIRSGHWDNQYANISMRGTSIPAFRNGMNVKMPWGPLADDMSTVERIEFVKGPAGFMMANGEPGGMYNVVTKKPTGTNQSSVSFTTGSYNTIRAAIDLDGKLSKDGKLLYRLNTAYQTRDTYNKFNYNDRYIIAPVISYQIDSNTVITAEYTHQHVEALALGNYTFSKKGFGEVGPEFFLGDPALNPRIIQDHNAFLYFSHRINDRWKLNAQIAYFNYSLGGGGTVWVTSIDSAGNMRRNYNIGDELAINKTGQLTLQGEERTGSVLHRILGGIDMGNLKTWGDFSTTMLGDLQLAGNANFNIYNPTYGIPLANIPQFDRSHSIRERSGSNIYATNLTYSGIYLQDEVHLFQDKLRLTVAARYTQSRTVGKTKATDIKNNVVTPRFGFSYSVNREMSIYGLYDQSYLPQAGADFDGNVFKPVYGNNTEFGIKKDWLGGKWNSTFTIYQITKSNVLTPDPRFGINNPQNWQVQLGQIVSKGVEFDLTGEIVPGLNATLNYAYTDPKVTKDETANPANNRKGTYLTGTAKHITNGWLTYRIKSERSALRGLGFSGGYQYQGERFAGAGLKESNFPDFFRLDAGVSYQARKINVSLLVNNLADKRMFTSGSAPANPRTGYYTYIYEFPRNFRLNFGYKF